MSGIGNLTTHSEGGEVTGWTWESDSGWYATTAAEPHFTSGPESSYEAAEGKLHDTAGRD